MPIVPKTLTSSGTKRGFFTRQDFLYDAGDAWVAKRCDLDLFQRCDAHQRFRRALVCQLQGRDCRRRVLRPGG
jgi:hypothetical protein